MSALIRTSILLVFVALSSASCSDMPPAGFELAYKEMQRLNLCIDLKTKRELVGPSFAFPSTFGGADPGDLEVWVSRVGRVDEAGRPDYIRPEMANKMGAYLVVAKIGQNENAEMLHNAIEKGIPLGTCRF